MNGIVQCYSNDCAESVEGDEPFEHKHPYSSMNGIVQCYSNDCAESVEGDEPFEHKHPYFSMNGIVQCYSNNSRGYMDNVCIPNLCLTNQQLGIYV